ncbi:tryptophan--tRNA ligase [Candidatus Pacearchaeota archaeon]|nr:tryptophan--tRNA ligase [Candidatus Pacearchaeota archaeon]|tara:strand:+ start:4468 stop:5586 length:1119 start_codon:yes stop_codon:yes gene_type:complete
MAKEMIVNPYDVQGDVDYARLGKEFGIKPLDEKLLKRIEKIAGEVHPYLRRGIFFAHRDLEKFLDDYENGKKVFLYTGCGPSGPIHLGHYTIWSFTKWLQDKFGIELWFQFTDDEKFLYKNKTFEEIQGWTKENMLDVIAIGFDPKKTHFLVDTQHAGIMYPEAVKVSKKITFSTIKASFGFNDSNNIGSIFYTAMQTVPIFLPSVLSGEKQRCLIPLAVDQDPHFRISRDVVEKLGHYKPSIIHSKFMSPLTGVDSKGSSSNPDKMVLMTDNAKTIKKKINKHAFSGGKETVEEHREKGGDVNSDVSCQWLRYFEEDDEKLAEIYEKYSKGELLSGEIKAMLIEKLTKALGDHNKRRAGAEKLIDKFVYKN